jgi:fimbrial chaperone protein
MVAQRRRRLIVVLFSVLSLLMLTEARDAWATSFEVSPVRLALSPATPSGLISLRNQSGETLRIEVTGHAWTQAPDGAMQLAPTQDIVFFPSLLTLSPGESRNLRVGASTSFGTMEKSYRIFVEELPPLARTVGEPNVVRVLTRMGIPVFLNATAPHPDPRVEGPKLNHDHFSFTVQNRGTAHFLAREVLLTALAADGSTVVSTALPAWYVLAGGVRLYNIDLSPAACAAASLQMKVVSDAATVDATFAIPAGTCKP